MNGELLELLRERAFSRRKVILTSGKESDFFIDCKQAVLSAAGHHFVGESLFAAVLALGKPWPDAVAGVALGGCSLASAVAQTSHGREPELDAVYVRKAAKEHGSQRLVEGDIRLQEGARVVILEDVVTTGGSTLRAVATLRDHGYVVDSVVALVDRSEGGGQALLDAGLRFQALFSRRDFMGEDEAGDANNG